MIRQIIRISSSILLGIGCFKLGEKFNIVKNSIIEQNSAGYSSACSNYFYNRYALGNDCNRKDCFDKSTYKILNKFHDYIYTNLFSILKKTDNIPIQSHQQFIKYCMENSNKQIIHLRFENCDDLDSKIMWNIAYKYNIVCETSKEDDVINYTYYGDSRIIDNLINNFWATYNLLALEFDKEGLPIGTYLPDDFITE